MFCLSFGIKITMNEQPSDNEEVSFAEHSNVSTNNQPE